MTIDTSFHIAFDQNGHLRDGFVIRKSESQKKLVCNCSNPDILNYTFEDSLLTDQEIDSKIKKITKNWDFLEFFDEPANLYLKLQKINPENRKAFTVFLKSFSGTNLYNISQADKEATYFTLILENLKKQNSLYAQKLTPFLALDPHKIPLFIKLLDNDQIELCDYLIDVSKKSDSLGSRKLIQAITNRLDDPNFDAIVVNVQQVLQTEHISLRWLSKLIKHDLFLMLKQRAPIFLENLLKTKSPPIAFHISFLKLYPYYPEFIEKYFDRFTELKAGRDVVLKILKANPVDLKKAELFISIPSEETMELLAWNTSNRPQNWLTLLNIYKADVETLRKAITNFDTPIPRLRSKLTAAGLSIQEFDQWNALTTEWNDFLYHRYLIYQHSPQDYEKLKAWIKSIGGECSATIEKATAYLARHPERIQPFLELVTRDPSITTRLIEFGWDFTKLKQPWQMQAFMDVLKGDGFTPKKMTRFYTFLLTHPAQPCIELALLHKESPDLFYALLKTSANQEGCSPKNLDWIIHLASVNPDLRKHVRNLFGNRLYYNDADRLLDLDALIERMRHYPAEDLKTALKVFSRNQLALLLHLRNITSWNTSTLVKYYQSNFSQAPVETKRLIDGVCRLVVINQWDILNQVTDLIAKKDYFLAQRIVDLVFTQKSNQAFIIFELLASKDPYSKLILDKTRLAPEKTDDLIALRDNEKFRTLYRTNTRVNDWAAFAKGYRKLNPEQQDFVFTLFSNQENVTPEEENLKTIIESGNHILFTRLRESPSVKTEIFRGLNFTDPNIQLFAEQILDLSELLKAKERSSELKDEAVKFCFELLKVKPSDEAVKIVSELLTLIDDQPKEVDFKGKVAAEYQRSPELPFLTYSGLIFSGLVGFNVKNPTLFATERETLLCDGLAKLLVMSNNKINLGLCRILRDPEQNLSSDWKNYFLYDDHFVKMLSLIESNREIQEVITSIRVNPKNTEVNEFIRKCLKIDSTKPVTDRDCQTFVMSAMLARLKQDDLGSCFATNLSIQLQSTQPLRKAEDLKAIIEKGMLVRRDPSTNTIEEIPLVYPNYIFDATNFRKQNGLLQMWDFSLANMAGNEQRMFARIRVPMTHLISKAVNKIDPKVAEGLCETILTRLKRDLRYQYEPTELGVFKLRHFSEETKSWENLKTHKEFIAAVTKSIKQLMDDHTGVTKDYLDLILKEVMDDPQVLKKLNELLHTTSANQHRLVHKQNIKSLFNFFGGYGASVLRHYFESRSLYEETFVGYTNEEIFERLIDLNNSIPANAIVSFFTMGHVSSFLKDHPSLQNPDLQAMIQQGNALLEEPFSTYSGIWLQAEKEVLEDFFPNRIENALTSRGFRRFSATLKEFLTIIPSVLESVTGRTTDFEKIALRFDQLIMENPVVRDKLKIVHMIYTNWYRQPVTKPPGLMLFSDLHWGFGFRPSLGAIGLYRISKDMAYIHVESLRDVFKTYKIRFIVQ